jgi:hypothetical protein
MLRKEQADNFAAIPSIDFKAAFDAIALGTANGKIS